MWDGVVRHLTVTDKLVPAFPFREVGDIMPSSLPAEAAASIIDLTAAAIRALGMTTGAVHTEQKLTGVGPALSRSTAESVAQSPICCTRLLVSISSPS